MSETGIAAFKLDDAAAQLREKIRHAFVELLTPEQWDAMVKAELRTFVEKRPATRDPYGYVRDPEKPSVFHEVAEQVYREHVKGLVKEEMAKPEWQAGWNATENKQAISEAIKEWLTDNAQLLLQTTIHELFAYQAQAMVERLRNGT